MSHSIFSHKTVFVVLGLGQSGLSVLDYLSSFTQNIMLVDTREKVKDIEIIKDKYSQFPTYLGTVPDDCYDKDCVWVVSPGVSLEHPWVKKAVTSKLRIENDISLFALENKVPLALITGTNGKSTVTTLLNHLLACAGINVGMGGNIGIPALSLLSHPENQVRVLEISSFQLEIATDIHAVVSTCLNVTNDHLDRHHTIENYRTIKHFIFNQSEWAVVNKSDLLNTDPKHFLGKRIFYHLQKPEVNEWGIEIIEGIEHFSFESQFRIPLADFNMVGDHNKLNALAALSMAHILGVPLDKLSQGLYSYQGLDHRCQLACELNGVKWINDSKGTNVDASLVAISGTLKAVPGNVYLIAGGDAKDADLQPMADIVNPRMPLVVLLGKDALRFSEVYKGVIETVIVKNMEEAVKMLAEVVKPGDAVLLSPACSSLDMYDNFQHRGRHFTELVKGLNCASKSTTN